MKKLLGLIIALCFGLTCLNAMSYEEARDRARFLTDKMAYELNLNDQQYNDAYEINLDYLMNIRTASDVTGVYLEYRNADLRFILYDWQYTLFRAASYFFRPVIWRVSGWFLPIYDIYSSTRFFFSPPRVFRAYRGGHYHYRYRHRQSFYAHRRPAWNGGLRGADKGPLPGRSIPAYRHHRPVGGNGSPGFRFETPGRPSRPNRLPTDGHRDNGFRLDPAQGKGTHTTRPSSPARPRMNDSNRKHPATDAWPKSSNGENYSRTRPMPNRPKVRPASPAASHGTSPRMQNRQQTSRSFTPSSSRKASFSSKRSVSAPRGRHEGGR